MNKVLYTIAFALTSLALLLICVFDLCDVNVKRHSNGYLTGSAGDTSLFLEKYDLSIKGWDKDGVTYFFLPSYVSLDSISQEKLNYKIFLKDGQLLSDPLLSTVQDVTVNVDGAETPWKIAFYSSANLHAVFFDLGELSEEDISHDEYIPATIRVFDADGSQKITGKQVFIKGRGNGTWEAEKKPFQIKAQEPLSICGMMSGKKWAFLANYYDDTKILNKMIEDLATEMGMECTITSDWADVYINGEYYGNYLICNEPSLQYNSTGIKNLEEDNTPFFSPEVYNDGEIKGYDYTVPFRDISGGYLIEKNWEEAFDEKNAGFHTGGYCFTLKAPDNASVDEVEYIRSYVQNADDAISSGSLSDIDIDSFCKRFIIEEFVYNLDSARTSYYFYKKQNDDLLYAGPCWDYDHSCGRQTQVFFLDYTGTLLNQGYDYVLDWDSQLMDNEQYKKAAAGVFAENCTLLKDTYVKSIDNYKKIVEAAVKMDRVRWLDNESALSRGYYDDIDNKFRYLKFFLNERMKHMVELFDSDIEIPDERISTDETHKLTFIYGAGDSVEWTVKDGTQIEIKDLPAYDHSAYVGWYYKDIMEPYSYYLPVYEDKEFVLMPENR